MSVSYKAVGWNSFKKRFNLALGFILFISFLVFLVSVQIFQPEMTAETIIIRYTSVSAFLIMHLILVIGPIVRIFPSFYPLLYNRRHLGVVMFLLAGIHSTVSFIQFHFLGNINPFESLLFSYKSDYSRALQSPGNLGNFPFEPFGLVALSILFIMAAISHDFWLKLLGSYLWKSIHQLVYFSYILILLHVSFGFIQSESHFIYTYLLIISSIFVFGVHILAIWKAKKEENIAGKENFEGFYFACNQDELQEGEGKKIRFEKFSIAIFLQNEKVFATGNICAHQGGPIGEGKILDGCITCPWHGWQYIPETGESPPPFREKIPVYPVKIQNGKVFVRREGLEEK